MSQENLAEVKVLEVADDPRLSREVKAFLALLNSGDGQAMLFEQRSGARTPSGSEKATHPPPLLKP